MKNYATDDPAQLTSFEKAKLDKIKVKKFNHRDTSKMYGLHYRCPDTTIYFRTADERDNKRPEVELLHGECVNVEPKKIKR